MLSGGPPVFRLTWKILALILPVRALHQNNFERRLNQKEEDIWRRRYWTKLSDVIRI